MQMLTCKYVCAAHLLTSGSSGTSTRATSPTLVEKQFSIGPGGRGAAASGLSEENYGAGRSGGTYVPPICDCEPRGRCVDLLSPDGFDDSQRVVALPLPWGN